MAEGRGENTGVGGRGGGVERLLKQHSPREDRRWGCSTDCRAKAARPHFGRRECFAVDLAGNGRSLHQVGPLESGTEQIPYCIFKSILILPQSVTYAALVQGAPICSTLSKQLHKTDSARTLTVCSTP
jgi:hypothetical protein